MICLLQQVTRSDDAGLNRLKIPRFLEHGGVPAGNCEDFDSSASACLFLSHAIGAKVTDQIAAQGKE